MSESKFKVGDRVVRTGAHHYRLGGAGVVAVDPNEWELGTAGTVRWVYGDGDLGVKVDGAPVTAIVPESVTLESEYLKRLPRVISFGEIQVGDTIRVELVRDDGMSDTRQGLVTEVSLAGYAQSNGYILAFVDRVSGMAQTITLLDRPKPEQELPSTIGATIVNVRVSIPRGWSSDPFERVYAFGVRRLFGADERPWLLFNPDQGWQDAADEHIVDWAPGEVVAAAGAP